MGQQKLYKSLMLTVFVPEICTLDSGIAPDLRHHVSQIRRDLDVLHERVRERGPLLQNFVEFVRVVSRLLGLELNI